MVLENVLQLVDFPHHFYLWRVSSQGEPWYPTARGHGGLSGDPWQLRHSGPNHQPIDTGRAGWNTTETLGKRGKLTQREREIERERESERERDTHTDVDIYR